MPAVSIPITILRLPNVESGRRPMMKIFKFYSGLFVWYMYESVNANFDDMGCTWNAGHVICLIFFNVAWQTVGVRKARKYCHEK